MSTSLNQIISGGQTGADQGGLFAARSLGIPTGGCCPVGWRTEDGPAPWLAEFGLVERGIYYAERTQENVKTACATVWFGDTKSPGFRSTQKAKHYFQRPWLVNPTAEQLRDWLQAHQWIILNVAGNRESTNPGINHRVQEILTTAIDGKPRVWERGWAGAVRT